MTDDGGLGVSDIVREDVAELVAGFPGVGRAFSGATVVIAGGAGFLLSYLVDFFAALNDGGAQTPVRIVVLDNFSSGAPARLAHLAQRPDVAIHDVNIAQPLELEGAADYVVHGASIASPPLYRQYPIETIEANVWGTRNLLEYAADHGARSFVYLSSSEIYGDPEASSIPTPEDYPGRVSSTGPRACYDESKRLGETLCVAYHQQRGVPAKMVRPFNVYGPRLSLDDGRIVPDLLRDALAGGPLRLFSDGAPTRSFCYVSDAIAGILAVLLSQHHGEPFNIGNDEEISIRQLAEIMGEVAPGNPPVEFETHSDPDYLVDNPNRRCPDITKSRELLGYEPRVRTREGLARTLSHYVSKEASADTSPADANAEGKA